MLSKKYYKEIARMIKDSENIHDFLYKFMEYAKQNNPKFDRTRFLKACEIEVLKVSQ
jgi:hypothetical protein